MRGLKSRHSRPDAIVLDDFENDEFVLTPDQRKKTWNWLMGAVVPMLHPKDGLLVVNGTVLHYDSALSKLLAQTDIYLTKRYKAIQDDGTALWPDLFPIELLLRKKTQIGSLKFGQEYQNDPIDDETQIFHPEYFRFWTKSQIHYDAQQGQWIFNGEPMVIWQGVDPAISEKEAADFFVVFTIGITPTNRIVCLDPYADHIDFISQVKKIIEKYQEWAPEQVGIETNAYQQALKQQVIKDSLIPVKSLDHHIDKFVRIQTMVPYFENGQVYIRAAMDNEPGFIDQTRLPGVRIHEKFRGFYEQAVTYAPKAAHDDILDGLQDAIGIGRPQVNPNELYILT
jgi:predicted phage terminase large subunit-like protein